MGNRAVIVTSDTNKKNCDRKIGIYVHWYGSENYIKEFLEEAKNRGIRRYNEDPQYFWARFIQTVADMITNWSKDSVLSVGVDLVSYLDTHNGDNGVYYINNDLEIVKHTNGSEFK